MANLGYRNKNSCSIRVLWGLAILLSVYISNYLLLSCHGKYYLVNGGGETEFKYFPAGFESIEDDSFESFTAGTTGIKPYRYEDQTLAPILRFIYAPILKVDRTYFHLPNKSMQRSP